MQESAVQGAEFLVRPELVKSVATALARTVFYRKWHGVSFMRRWAKGRQDPYYEPGSWNITCDRTGFKVKASKTQKEWTGRIVRQESFELRQPQDLIRVRPERQMVPDPRSEATDNFLATNEVVASDL